MEHDTEHPAGWLLGGRYRVLDRLGAGGMAEVFRARDELLNRDVAVKVFRTPVDEPGNVSAADRRQHELQALAQLNHPNLITLYDGSLAGGSTAYLVMELVDGPNLAARLLDGPLPEPQARELGVQIADALAYVHDRGMVHRDVKPANILLGTDVAPSDPAGMRARLSDFGIVRMVDSARLTSVAFTLGTASYLAPEQARGADVGPAADVYAFGLVLLETLTGTRSFDGPQHEAMAARLVRGPDIPPDLPTPWPGLLTAMTAIDPAARPSAAEVAAALRHGVAPVLPPLPAVTGADAAATQVIAVPPLVPAGAAAFTPALAAVTPVAAVEEPLDERHHGRGMLIAALSFLAVIAVAGFLIMRPTGGGGAPSGSTTGSTTGTTTGSPIAKKTTGGHSASNAAVVVTDSSAAGPRPSASTKKRSSSSASSSARASSSSKPSTSAPTSASPSASSTSAKPSSSPPPSTSAAPSSPSTTAKSSTATTAAAPSGAGAGPSTSPSPTDSSSTAVAAP